MNNKVTSVIYQDPNGKNANGYIIDGKTYKDSAGTQRVDIGSTVPTAGGTYTLTGTGGVKTPQSIANDLRKGYADSATYLSDGLAAEQQSINAATKRTLNALDEQKKDAGTRYRDANRAAYQAYVNASNPYGAAAEQKSRIGLANSGYSETSKMNLANTYQQSMGENARARDEYLREIDNAYREAQYNGDILLANALADYSKLVYQHGISAAEAIANQENAAYTAGMAENNNRWNRDMQNRKFAADEAYRNRQFEADEAYRNRQFEADENYRKQQLALSRARSANSGLSEWERAFKLASSGYSNEWIAAALGLSMDELNYIVNGGAEE